MATTLVNLETLKSLSNIARERGRLLPLIDVLLEWAEHAETHIAHMARLLEGQGITCSCQEMDPADPNCLLHGYVEMDDPLPEPGLRRMRHGLRRSGSNAPHVVSTSPTSAIASNASSPAPDSRLRKLTMPRASSGLPRKNTEKLEKTVLSVKATTRPFP